MSTEFPEYPKINSLWKRHKEGPLKGQVITDSFAQTEYAYLQHNDWHWTEKVDGTNVRLGYFRNGVEWTRHSALQGPNPEPRLCVYPIGGRTDKAEFNGNLIKRLQEIQRSLPYREVFPEGRSVVLYGEGYGAGVQKIAGLDKEPNFILFDALVDGRWLDRFELIGVAEALGLPIVPLVLTGSIQEATWAVQEGWFESAVGAERPEGVVGTPISPLRDRYGRRIQTKIKWADVGRLGEGSK